MSDQSSPARTVLVTDADRGSALAIIRSLGRRGWRVVAADSHPGSLGFRSRFAAAARVYPAPQSDAAGMVAALRRAVDEEGVDLLIPVTDDVILPLSAAREQFAGRCIVAMPDPDQLEIVTNKQRTVELAQRLGVPAPATVVVRTVDEARAALGTLGWPVVVKPQVSRLYDRASGVDKFEVTYAPDAATLLRVMGQFEGRCPVLLQEYYPGTGYGVELLMHAGRPLAAFQHKRLHEVPITGGASSFRQSVALDPELYRHGVRLLEALHWTGLAMVEFKVGEDGPRLMEINGRIWGSLPLATLSGMDFPARLAALYVDGPPAPDATPDTRYRVGLKARNFEKDVLWIGSVLVGRRHAFLPAPPRRAALGGLLSLFDPRTRSDLWAADDLRPFVAEFPKVAAKLLRKGAMAGERRGDAP